MLLEQVVHMLAVCGKTSTVDKVLHCEIPDDNSELCGAQLVVINELQSEVLEEVNELPG